MGFPVVREMDRKTVRLQSAEFSKTFSIDIIYDLCLYFTRDHGFIFILLYLYIYIYTISIYELWVTKGIRG